MEESKVYFSDFRTKMNGDSMLIKFRKLLKKAGIDDIDYDKKLVAIKMHFGEPGNLAFLRPNYAKVVADLVKEMGGRPFLTDCNTLYPGRRKNALEHLEAAWENGFSPLSTGCPIIIGDGLKGTDDIAVPVKNGKLVKEAKIGRAIMDADVFISLTHFKGHEMTGFGGTLKNIGMGCGSRAGKAEQHSSGKPEIDEQQCRGCRICQKQCANEGLVYNEAKHKMTVNYYNCVGCSRCLGACNFDAIYNPDYNAAEILDKKIAEYAMAVVDGRPTFHISVVMDISPNCDCHEENDAPILPDVGMFASFDPVALDQACVDACLRQEPTADSQLMDRMTGKNFHDYHDHFKNSTPESEWKACLEHAEQIGLGSRSYKLIIV